MLYVSRKVSISQASGPGVRRPVATTAGEAAWAGRGRGSGHVTRASTR